MIIFLSILLFSVIVVGYFIVSNLLSQVEQLESSLQSSIQKEVDFVKYYDYFIKLFTEAHLEMVRVDKRGAFSSDDEVGFSFKVIYRAIEDVKKKLAELEEINTNADKNVN